MSAVRRLISILGLSLAAVASAQPQTTTTSPAPATADVPRTTAPVTADTDRDVNDPRALKLSLADAISTSMRQNLGIELQRFSTEESGQSLITQYGVFDPVAFADLKRSTADSPSIAPDESGRNAVTSAIFGVQQNLPTGGNYQITSSNQRNTSSGQQNIGGQLFQSTTGLSYPTSLGATLSQPLARNFGIDITRRNINIARNTLGISREQFRSVLLDTTNGVEQAYYDLVYARQYVDVVKEAAFLARDQARITQIRINVGASAPLDILQPQVQEATTEQQLIAAIANVRSAEDRLRQLMNLPAAEWDRPIVPTDTAVYTPVTIDVDAAVAQAYTLRPEIRQDRLQTANARIQYLYARNQTLPQVDANLGYNLAGIAGRAVDANNNPINTTYSTAIRQVLTSDFPGWNVGLTIGVPIFNIAARAEAKRSQLDFERSKTFEQQTRQSITVDVRSTARSIDTAAKEIVASRTAREAAERNLDAERKRYENGMSTNFQVLQVQQQLTDSRASELQALVNFDKSVTAFHRAVGDLLDLRGIAVEEPAAPEEPHFFSRWDRYHWLNFGNQVKNDPELAGEAQPQ